MADVTITIRGLSWRWLALIISGGVLAVALAVGAIIYIRANTTLVGLPHEVYDSLNFPVYFPHHPPAGFSFDTKSVSTKANVLTYAYHYQGQKPVFVSIQPLDPQLDVTTFRPTREITPRIGHGYLADFGSRTTVAVVTAKSLVLINSPDGVPDGAIEQFTDSLQPVY
ncbi:MAG TPA: hypothetical protein VHQ86_02395 [Candidatus Saccharimonadia bacterium]|nr:hypothetical protein [Candidatus Saccharimonadia bacterium]